MTVAELILKLQKYDGNLPVLIYAESSGEFNGVDYEIDSELSLAPDGHTPTPAVVLR